MESNPEVSPEVSIVMPCLNESETLGVCIEKAQRALREGGIAGEILIGDNGSTDGSQEIARRLGAIVVPVSARGYGSALMGGFAAAKGKFIIMADSDDSYDFLKIPEFVEKLREGFELVMGNRFLGGIEPGAMPPLHRYLGNPVLSGIGRLFFHCPCGDFHCGMRGFTKSAVDRLDLRTTGMEFASEMVIKATLFKLKIAEIPTTLSPDGRSRPPHLRSWRDGWRHLRFMLLYSPRWLFLYPGLFLMAVGLLASLWLLPGPRTIGDITFDVHTLLYCVMVVLAGFQSVIFSIFSKVFAITEDFLPRDPRLNSLFRWITLETGLVVGFIFLLGGLLVTALEFRAWGNQAYGPLNASHEFRRIIPAVTMLILGVQIILSSFFLSLLGMARR